MKKNDFEDPIKTGAGSKKITISNSFDEASDAQLRYWAGLTPEQRFTGFYELMSRFYTLTVFKKHPSQ